MAGYGYCRVSTLRQASEGDSLDVQRRQIEGYAIMHGLALDEIVVEEGVSGSTPVNERPAGGALFAKLQKGDIIVAPKLDRLFRSALDALQVVGELKARGLFLGGKPPFGFRVGEGGVLVPDDAEQAAIRQIIALRAQGKALRAIRDALRAKGLSISHEGVAGVLRAHA